jgi:hypothetical protein
MFFFTSPKTKHTAKPTKTKTPLNVFFFHKSQKPTAPQNQQKQKWFFTSPKSKHPAKPTKTKTPSFPK